MATVQTGKKEKKKNNNNKWAIGSSAQQRRARLEVYQYHKLPDVTPSHPHLTHPTLLHGPQVAAELMLASVF